MIQKAAASSPQHTCSCIKSHAEYLLKHQIIQVIQPLYSPDLVFCNFWLFPKLTTFEREDIWDCWWDSGKYKRATDGNSNKEFCSVLNSGKDAGRTVWGPKVTILKGTELLLPYAQCFLYFLWYMSSFFMLCGWTLSGQTSYTLNIREPKHIKQVLTSSKGEMDINIIIVGDFCIALSTMGRLSGQKINKGNIGN